ncbi:MAG TPA: hypothetical protein VHK91_12755 [Flavisolibacter sp.]|jgi:hypothetical protein|nr:hypothetical protein [Flavisolibacter sp.]
MASTSLEELYFRSLKRIKVLTNLTKYLLQYKQLHVPHIGTLEIIQQSPEFDVVDKVILPPVYKVRLNDGGETTDQQIRFLSVQERKEPITVREELDQFGQKLKAALHQNAFSWKGVGILEKKGSQVHFSNDLIAVNGLGMVAAEKLIRENAEHAVLVGDQEMTSTEVHESRLPVKKARNYAVIIGWILFIVTLLIILYLLYRGNFQTGATGLQLRYSFNGPLAANLT